MKTLYALAGDEIRLCIADYLSLLDDTSGLTNLAVQKIDTDRKVTIILAGLNVHNANQTAQIAFDEWQRRQAIPCDIENAIATNVYVNLRSAGVEMLDFVEKHTSGFQTFSADFIAKNPACLPIFQHLSGVFSKAALKKAVGSVSDNSISKPASVRVTALLKERVVAKNVNKGEVLSRLDSTLEGIVRDLVGRVLPARIFGGQRVT